MPGDKNNPYLLRDAVIDRPTRRGRSWLEAPSGESWWRSQRRGWVSPPLPMARGFVSLTAVVDWFSRRVLSWRLSMTLEIDFCVDAVEDALAKHGRPESFNTDQGSPFTSTAFTGQLLKNEIAISMDGRGAWRDTVFVERIWRSVKYEEVYLHAYDSVGEARAPLGKDIHVYNSKRPYSSLEARTPDRARSNHTPKAAQAA